MLVHKAEDESRFHPLPSSTIRHLLQDFDGNASIIGGAVDIWALSQGISIDAMTTKKQILPPALWNLDRIDQRHLPLDSQFVYGSMNDSGIGQGVTIYVLDSGIMKDHQEFVIKDPATNSTSSRAAYGWNFINNTADCSDFDGHGSHVAGITAGIQVGIAKGANIVSVRVLDDKGSGTVSTTVAGLEWVVQHHKKPAVVILSLGVQQGSYSKILENSVTSVINDHQIIVVTAAGNAAGDACTFSPALVSEAITVGASDILRSNEYAGEQQYDGMYHDGNQGPCVDIIAPGVDIYSVCGGHRRCGNITSSTYALASGTSMATPHVAGFAAVIVSKFPSLTPHQVTDIILKSASLGSFADGELRHGTTNKMLFASNYSAVY